MTSRLDRLNLSDYALPEELLARLMTPALVIHMRQVRRNIAQMLDYLDGDTGRWRPHLKTTKIGRIYEELLSSGLRQFKCATVREARTLLAAAARTNCPDVDLLIAYPPHGPRIGYGE